LPALLLIFLVCGASLGCGPRRAPGAADAAGSAEAPRRGGTLVTAWTAEPGGINELITPPTNTQLELLILLYDRLLEEQGDYQKGPPTFAPLLARSYEWSADHKDLTFHLREDAVWSDGVPVTADDVRFTWQAETSPDVAWEYAYTVADVSDVKVLDPHTVRFHFKRVFSKQLLSVNDVGVLPRHVWGQIPFAQWRQNGAWFKQHAVSCGPYVIESWTPQQEIVLRRNPRYYDQKRPYIDRVVMRVLPSYANVMTQLESGDIDYTPVVNPGDAARIAANPRLRLLPFWYRTVVSVTWNGARPPFNDPEVRRALGMALDRQAIVDTIWKGYARLSDSPVVTAVWAHDPALRPLPHDPAGARRILAAKGWAPGADGILRRDGKPFKFELLTNAGNHPGPIARHRRAGRTASGRVQLDGHHDRHRRFRGDDGRREHGHRPRPVGAPGEQGHRRHQQRPLLEPRGGPPDRALGEPARHRPGARRSVPDPGDRAARSALRVSLGVAAHQRLQPASARRAAQPAVQLLHAQGLVARLARR
jgi:peptide/nickel transport system substrate-binding protein